MCNAAAAPRRRRPAAFLLALLAALPLASLAAPPLRAAETFRIEGVPVDATAESAVAARQIAIDQGQRDGLTRMMQRLTAPADRARLPDVRALPVDGYVASYEVAQEKVGPTRYVATLNVSYVPAEVQRLLQGAGLPYVARRSDPILVVPVEETPTGPAVWLEDSPWRLAWYDALDQATVVALALPLADLGDVAAAPASAVAAGDRAALDALAQRYGTQRVAVVVGRLDRAPEGGGLARVAVVARDGKAWDRVIARRTIEAVPGETEAQTLARATGAAVAAIEDDWKTATLARAAGAATVVAAVPLADLAGWVQIRRDLTGLGEVRSLQLDSLSRTEARVAIGYDGDLAQLSTALARVGLALAEENDGWHLRPAAIGPAPAPSPGPPPTP